MGKAGDAEQAIPSPAPATGNGSILGRYGAVVGKALNAKCAFMLLLAVGVSLSAFSLLLHRRASGIIPDDPGTLVGDIQAGFILLKPRSTLASHARRLEEEIHSDMGVPNSKVSVSMHTFKLKYSTYVKFSIFPDPRDTSISEQSMSRLRKNLTELTLQQLNLSLTPSVFGDPFCLEMLRFPGGITMTLPHYNFTVDVLPIFNFTLDMSIHQIRKYVEEMKIMLVCTLEQAPHEDLLIDLTNKNGSTVTPPVTVQVSLSPDDCSIYRLPYRLKQIAEIITELNSTNIGLNPLVYGRIKDLKLSPLLQGFNLSRAPNLSPTPIPSPSRPPCSQPTTNNRQEHFLCPDLVRKLNAAFPHRKLMQLSPMATSPRLPTQSHSHSVNTTGWKKNSMAVAAPTFIAPASQPS